MSTKRIGVVFGGVSVEHEVSVITGVQAALALDPDRYEAVPVYIAKDGIWYTGKHLLDIQTFIKPDAARQSAVTVEPRRADGGGLLLAERSASWWRRPRSQHLDAVLLALHGAEGENGSIQGLMEVLNVPYSGSGVTGSALGMDKDLCKKICRDQNIPVVPSITLRETDWVGSEEAQLERIVVDLGFPVIVKPARLGSSVGISKADNREALGDAIEEAMRYDEKVLVEKAVMPLREINCAVLGSPGEATTSALEEPVRSAGAQLLTFHEKYERGGGKQAKGAKASGSTSTDAAGMASMERRVPADLPPDLTEHVKDLALRIFKVLECAGIARIDFLLEESVGKVYFNEINTIPGSLSFYLFKPVGMSQQELMTRLVEVAFDRHRAKNQRIRSYDTNLLALQGLQGSKSAK